MSRPIRILRLTHLNHRHRRFVARALSWTVLVSILVCTAVLAQRSRSGRGYGYGYGYGRDNDSFRTPREIPQHGGYETPSWTNTPGFEKDVFTFCRVKRDSKSYYYRRGGPWDTDTPDSDLNLSYRLQQLTAMKVDPDGRFLRLSEKDLSDYPFLYIVEPGSLQFRDEEVAALRKYLLNGGFLMLDDFWGDSEWENMESEMRRVFPEPERRFVELSLTNALYHCVFDIKSKGQIPAVDIGTYSQYSGVTWESHHDGDVRTVHHKVIYDDKGRIMVFAAHNTDNGDGWEWEGNNHYYFEHFSEAIAYPLAVNVIFYCMTH